jgi:hypothetical protein
MHHLDLGLFCYQINFTYEIIKLQHGNTLVDEMNRRLAAIPRFPDLKIFSNGLHARLTASEYRNLMKVMLFVVDNLYDENEDAIDNFIENDDLSELYEMWNEMYILSRYEEFSESDLAKFEVSKQKFIKIKLKN